MTTTRETADHAELARLAAAAAKGEWWSDDDVISHQEVSREDERFIYAFTPAVCSALLSEIAALRGEVETLTTSGIIEVAVRNPSVADYVQHWEGRVTQAERQRDELRKAADAMMPLLTLIEEGLWEDCPYPDVQAKRIASLRTQIDNQGADQ